MIRSNFEDSVLLSHIFILENRYNGAMAFTVPLFDEFMRRAIPNFKS